MRIGDTFKVKLRNGKYIKTHTGIIHRFKKARKNNHVYMEVLLKNNVIKCLFDKMEISIRIGGKKVFVEKNNII